MKRVYVVKTSEDGNIGVFTNVKKIYEALVNYAKIGGNDLELSYNDVLKEIRAGYGYIDINGTDVDIQEFRTNQF